MVDLYALFQVSQTTEMIILAVLSVMFFAIIYDILYRAVKFPKSSTMIIAAVITILALFSGFGARAVHAILSLGIIFGSIGLFVIIILMFIAFFLVHLGLGKIALWMRRR